MLTLEQQVCSLELAKRLKELGLKQDNCFYWSKFRPHGENFQAPVEYSEPVLISLEEKKEMTGGYREREVICSAFTVAELGEMLPGPMTMPEKSTSEIWCHYHGRAFVQSKTEADARAKMMIYLIENNLIDFNGLITTYTPALKDVKP